MFVSAAGTHGRLYDKALFVNAWDAATRAHDPLAGFRRLRVAREQILVEVVCVGARRDDEVYRELARRFPERVRGHRFG